MYTPPISVTLNNATQMSRVSLLSLESPIARVRARLRASGLASMPFPVKLVFFLQAFGLLTVHTHGQKKEDVAAEEVKIEVLHVPKECKPKSKKGDLLNAHYDGYLASDGSKFYCSRTQNEGHPKWFVLGVGQVIKGLDIAMMDMCPGEKRKVTIPPSLAYGKPGYGSA